jgi:hypothetical protein
VTELSALAQPLIDDPPRRPLPVQLLQQRIARRRRRRLLAAGALVAVVAGVLAAFLRTDPVDVVTTGPASQSSSTVSTVSRDAPPGMIGVEDGAGRVRGYVRQADLDILSPPSTLPGGFVADPVRDERGRLTGYFVTGKLGFVDVDTAADPDKLAALDRCYEVYASTQETPDDCAALLEEQGFNPHRRGSG